MNYFCYYPLTKVIFVSIFVYVIERMALNEKQTTNSTGDNTMANKNNNIELVNLTFVSGKDLMKNFKNSFVNDIEINEKIAPKKKLFAHYLPEKKIWQFHKMSKKGAFNSEILFSFKMKKHSMTLVDGFIPVYTFDRSEFEHKFNESLKNM